MKATGTPLRACALTVTAAFATAAAAHTVWLEPIAGVRAGAGDDPGEGAPVSDSEGVARFVPVRGFNRLWAGLRVPVQGEPRFTELSYEYTLGFWAQ